MNQTTIRIEDFPDDEIEVGVAADGDTFISVTEDENQIFLVLNDDERKALRRALKRS